MVFWGGAAGTTLSFRGRWLSGFPALLAGLRRGKGTAWRLRLLPAFVLILFVASCLFAGQRHTVLSTEKWMWIGTRVHNFSYSSVAWRRGSLWKSGHLVKSVAYSPPLPNPGSSGRLQKGHGRHASACISELSLSDLCSSVGLASLLLATLEHLDVCARLGLKPIVRWTDCVGACSSSSSLIGKNYWLRYFYAVSDLPHEWTEAERVFPEGALCLGEPLSISSSSLVSSTSAYARAELGMTAQNGSVFLIRGDSKVDRERRSRFNLLLSKFVNIRPELQLVADHFGQLQNVLGIHVRGTDQAFVTGPGRSPPLSIWIKSTETLLAHLSAKHKPSEQIVVAADSEEAVEEFRQHFGDGRILALRDPDFVQRAKRHNDFHWSSGMQVAGDRLGNGVLIDMQLLSRCRWLLTAPSPSAVATAAAYFNPDLVVHSIAASSLGIVSGLENDDNVDGMQDTAECFQRNKQYSGCSKLRSVLSYAALPQQPLVNIIKPFI